MADPRPLPHDWFETIPRSLALPHLFVKQLIDSARLADRNARLGRAPNTARYLFEIREIADRTDMYMMSVGNEFAAVANATPRFGRRTDCSAHALALAISTRMLNTVLNAVSDEAPVEPDELSLQDLESYFDLVQKTIVASDKIDWHVHWQLVSAMQQELARAADRRLTTQVAYELDDESVDREYVFRILHPGFGQASTDSLNLGFVVTEEERRASPRLVRNLIFRAWHQEGLSYEEIRYRWNREHPAEKVSGLDAVRKGISTAETYVKSKLGQCSG